MEERWQAADIQSVIWVKRYRVRLKDEQSSQEQACFVSNKPIDDGLLLAGAIRHHWQIESDHYVRDTTGGEDRLRCRNAGRIRSIASLLTVGSNLFRAYDRGGNLRACWEDCTADRLVALACWKASTVL